MGAPLRTLCPGAELERDLAWLSEQAEKQAAEVALLFAHIGLTDVDAAAVGRHGNAYTEYKARATVLPQSKAQVQMLLTRFCLATRLNCLATRLNRLARYLPTAISQPALGTIDELLIGQSHGRGPGPHAPRHALWGNSHRGRDVSSCPAPQLRGDR